MRRTRAGLGFAVIPLLGIITPLLVLPVLTSRFGEPAWVAVAVGQSIGAGFVTIGEMGWGLSGPQRVARQAPTSALSLSILSIQTRLVVLGPLALVTVCAALLISPTNGVWAASVALATLLTSLSLSWMFLGQTRPWLVVTFEAFPRLIGLAIAAGLMLVGFDFWVYPVVGLGIPAIVAVVLSLAHVRRQTSQKARIWKARQVRLAIRSQWSAVLTRSSSALYIALPVSLVSIVSPDSVAVFAAGERILRICLGGLIALPNAMQGWVGSASQANDRRQRVRKSIGWGIAMGLVGGVLFAFLAPTASSVLFSGVATIPPSTAAVFGTTLAIVCISRITGGIGLVASRQVNRLAQSALLGALVGVPAILVLALFFGAVGGAAGELAAEAAVLSFQWLSLKKYLRTT